MKVLETLLTVLAWIMAGTVIWAIAPFVLKMVEMAQRLHNVFQ